MSVYTTELRYICETAAGLNHSEGYNSVNDIIRKAVPNIFNFDFPIFDENYRNVLCTKILKHYYTREIAFETTGLFRLKLDTKLNEIMPYYNKLYKTELLEFNPLYDVDITTEHIRKNDNKQDSTGNRSGTQDNTVNDNQTTNRTIDVTDTNNIKTDATDSNNLTTDGTDSNNITSDGNTTTENSGSVTGNTSNSRTINKEGESSGKVETNLDGSTKRTEKTTTDTTENTTSDTDETTTDRLVLGHNTNTSATNVDLYNDTPQGMIPDGSPPSSLDWHNYMTNARRITNIDEKHETGNDDHTINRGIDVTGTGTSNSTVEGQTIDTRLDDTVQTSTGTTGEQTIDNDSGESSQKSSETGTGTTHETRVGSGTTHETRVGAGTYNETKVGTGTTNSVDAGTADRNVETNIKSSETTSGNIVIDNLETYVETVKGKRGGASYSQMIIDFRKSLLNIDMMVIRELEDLFFQLWE